jgi:CP family cyanate transporter-like MFS transporter
MTSTTTANAGLSTGSLLKALCLLWLAGMAMRITILAVPPVIPLIHDDLHMTETQVGLLIGMPLVVFALAAVPGSILIARFGARLTMAAGLLITALAAAGRGAAPNIWWLYAGTMVMGFGVAIMQPSLLALVREWIPRRIGLGTAISTNGIVAGATLGPAFTISVVLPLVGQSWRLDLVVWAALVLAIAMIFFIFAPRGHGQADYGTEGQLWWPDWKSPLPYLLGVSFGCCNSIYFGANAFLADFLSAQGRPDLIGAALGWLNGSQLIASFVFLAAAEYLRRRVWPFLVFGPAMLAGLFGIVFGSGGWIVAAAGVVGFAAAVAFILILAMPPYLSRPGDVHRTSAGMFTISYSCAVIIPMISGGLWDLTGIPWTAFVPLGICAIILTVLGFALSRQQPARV